MKRVNAVPVLVLSSLLVGAGSVAANDQDLLATTVPATACQPANPTSHGRVGLTNGAWVFLPGVTGTAYLWCTLPVNMYTVSDASQDNDITYYRILYRDSDGAGNAAQLTVRLGYRHQAGFTWAGSTWVSTGAADTNTFDHHWNPHDVAVGVYSFMVTITRTVETEDPAFGGIDFIPPAIG